MIINHQWLLTSQNESLTWELGVGYISEVKLTMS